MIESNLKHYAALWFCLLVVLMPRAGRAASAVSGEFEQANKLYEQGKFREAVAAYQQLIDRGVQSPAIYFNLGNGWYKAGQNGRAVAAYLQAERLAPRDPSIRFNLDFIRRRISVTGAAVPFWQRWLRRLSVNEWAIAAAAAVWIWMLLLAAREIRRSWQPMLRGYTLWSGVLAAILILALAAAVYDRNQAKTAVVVVPEATVRYGPLEESQTFYKLPDGSEVRILDEKINSKEDAWVQIEDAHGRPGWVKRDQVLPVFSGLSAPKSA
jgi:tetratricopeptide (TPR) repeat protein